MLDQEEHIRNTEKSQDQEVVQEDREPEVNLEAVIEVSVDPVRVLFQDQRQDLDHARVRNDPEVRLRVAGLDRNQSQDQDQDCDQNRDLGHIIEVTQEIVIAEDIILSQNQHLNRDPELNLSLDLDQDPEVNLDANVLEVPKLRCRHCQGINTISIPNIKYPLYSQSFFVN